MTKLLVVCLGVILSWPALETFTLADRVGGPDAPATFFRFSTGVGKYTIRHDGLGEASAFARRRVFHLKREGKGRIERVYFLEHEGDLLLRYDVMGQGSYLMRMDQKHKKPRWFTGLLGNLPSEAPVINGQAVIVSDTIEISKADGKIIRQD